MRRALASIALIAALVLPVSAGAASIEELQAQIGSLLSQITALQAQIAILNTAPISSTSNDLPVTATTNTALCSIFARTLQRGLTGVDVMNLQIFLAHDTTAAYTGGLTGYFGPATEAALQHWQAAHGIVSSGTALDTGFGVLGPKTRAAMQSNCIAEVATSKQPTIVAPVQISCPLIDIPSTCSGTLVSRGQDTNGCWLGYSCIIGATSTVPNPVSCPSITRPACPTGQHYENGTPAYTLSSNGQCQVPNLVCVNDTVGLSVSVSPSSVAQGSAPLTTGDTLHISWTYTSAPNASAFTDSAVELHLIDAAGTNDGVIRGGLPITGSYDWKVPGPQCSANGNCVYQTDSNSVYQTKAGPYIVEAVIYTPSNGCLGFSMMASCPKASVLVTGDSAAFSITQ